MKIFTACSTSHEPLLALSMDSQRNEPAIERFIHALGPRGNGDYGDADWKRINEDGTYHAEGVLKYNLRRKIGFIDADVVFLKPFVTEIEALLDKYDAVFQREYPDDDCINPGVMFLNVSPLVIEAWGKWAARLGEWDGHLHMQNQLMREAFSRCKIYVLPAKYAARRNGGSGPDAVLFHANGTPPPDSVAQKLAAMRGAFDG